MMQQSTTEIMQVEASTAQKARKITGTTMLAAGLYIFSGVSQPLLMTVASKTGIADPRAQLYMLAYYAGPASVGFTLKRRKVSSADASRKSEAAKEERYWPSLQTIAKAASIAILDIVAQSLNYTGNNVSGPTIFAVIYSSVTIWAAVYSRCLLGRALNRTQWVGVASVFLGLALTAFNSVSIGQKVFVGACLVVAGSSMHALTYVISEMLMTVGQEKISARANSAVQGIVACSAMFMWQVLYTLPRFQELIGSPVEAVGSSKLDVFIVLGSISLANLVHSLSFFHTLKNFPGGSVSAGVMKGLQAVLVFLLTSIFFCGSTGTGAEMCFDSWKFVSLFVVVGGVVLYGWATDDSKHVWFRQREGQYRGIPDRASELEIISGQQ
mmetsp:Transcript_10460/g.16919  ORF Transcript_10460/g.16919 Transcript_10460/m.16919 type:complete len:383 (+) Transcript_10460:259-1407(+)